MGIATTVSNIYTTAFLEFPAQIPEIEVMILGEKYRNNISNQFNIYRGYDQVLGQGFIPRGLASVAHTCMGNALADCLFYHWPWFIFGLPVVYQ